eukprot:452613-Hanusia_phi.AAC.4
MGWGRKTAQRKNGWWKTWRKCLSVDGVESLVELPQLLDDNVHFLFAGQECSAKMKAPLLLPEVKVSVEVRGREGITRKEWMGDRGTEGRRRKVRTRHHLNPDPGTTQIPVASSSSTQ